MFQALQIELNMISQVIFICYYSRVSVIRGQVVTPQGLGIIGIRVSVDKDARFGFTLTRTGGWYVFYFNFNIFKHKLRLWSERNKKCLARTIVDYH
jgi:hypothetical protein